MIRHTMALLAALLLGACASDPAPSQQMRLSEQALEQARSVVGADAAALEAATAGLAAAQDAYACEDYRAARMLAERAELDARLVEAQALTGKSRSQLAELRSRIAGLRQQLGELP